ncbi:MAG: methyltransferase domain-containing protein [Alphaproteobacteria bacterium]|nr:methyltransferase domain-containing protein [Alphaproteobacteria bacterium]NDC56186.1 methyltransferase domain-containing protein [Alphaproteobacteria bacterium]NDG04555.1 methyltransferase domain-containing protein [Alphaproteobacteria bacterium]
MKTEDFELLSGILKQRSGLVLTPEKAYLLESRLLPVARKYSLKGLDELAAQIRSRRDEAMLRDMTEAMTTNESSFFRDQKPFDQFKNIIMPHVAEARAAKKQVRVWSAACSSGQEAYSLTMLWHELAAKYPGWKLEIMGTDLSAEMVERSRSGIYTQFEVQRGLPIQLLMKYFTQQGDKWQINTQCRALCQFKEMNLLQDFGPVGVFDIIYCRNVLIYFDPPTKTRVLEAMSKVLAPDGALYLGGAETVLGLTDKFRPVDANRGLYVLSSAPAALYSGAAAVKAA